MREIKMPRGSKISLQPLYLTIEEEEERKDLYQKIVKSHFPSLREIDYKEYGELQKSLPNKDSEKILKDVALSIACNQLIYIFLHYNIKKIEFEDYLQDMYVLVEDKFQTYSNAKFLSEFKFFFENLTFRYVMSKCNKASRHNLDIYKSLMGKLDYNSDMDNISSNKYNTMEYNWLYSEFVEKVNKCLNTLSAKKKQLLIKYYVN